MDNVELSYQAHSKNWEDRLDEKELRFFQIKNKDSISYQLVKRSLDVLKPFLMEDSRWLTVGDYNGLEANFLKTEEQKVVASDISDAFLQEAQKEGFIDEYAQVNAEKIPFDDNSFDYVFCKEAYHHFPKAFLSLYEMIRCSKKATILLEPIDILAKMPTLLFIKNILDRINPNLINKLWKNRFSFETVGNYVFKISEREVEKIAMGMGLPCIAFKKHNVLMSLNVDESIINQTPMNIKYWKKINRKLWFKNLLGYFHLLPYNHLFCIIFKEKPSEEVIKEMKSLGYIIIGLPENPYLKA